MGAPFRIPAVALCLLLLSTPGSAVEPAHKRLGFFEASVSAQARGEEVFLATPTPRQAEEWLRQLTEEPHVAGTENDRALAEMVRERLKEYGFQVETRTYPVLLNYPKRVSLKLLQPSTQELSLFEEGYSRDKDSFSRDAFP